MIVLQNLPPGWNVCRLKTLARIRYGLGQPPRTMPGGLPLIRATNVDHGRIVSTDLMRVDPADVPKSRDAVLQAGDIIVVRSGAYTADSAIIPPEYSGAIAGYDMVVRATEASPRFLAYTLLSKYVKDDQLLLESLRAAQPHLNAQELGATRVLLPPQKDQAAIVTFLDRKLEQIGRYIATKRRQIELIEEQEAQVISSATSFGLRSVESLAETGMPWIPEVVARWHLTRLKYAAVVQTGITLGKNYGEADLITRPYLRVANVQDGHLKLSDVAEIRIPPSDAARCELQPGDVLMTEGGDIDKLGRGQLWNGEISGCLHQNHIFAVRTDRRRLLPEYLVMQMRSRHGRMYFMTTAKKTTNLASTNSTTLKAFPLFLPDLAEQRAILDWIANRTATLRRAVQITEREVDLMTEYRTALIAEVVTGKFDVRRAD
jgi:type I restriction enzyme S subunit